MDAVACRFAAGVWKNVEADRFWVAIACVDAGPPGVCVVGGEEARPFVGADEETTLSPSRICVWHPESMWLLISDDLTALLQIGQTTMVSEVRGSEQTAQLSRK